LVKKALPGGEKVFMLVLAAICWTIWKARNKTCFFITKGQSKTLVEVIYLAYTFIRYWVGFYSEDTHVMINEGVKTMMRTSRKILRTKVQPAAPMMITEGAATTTDKEEAQNEGESASGKVEE
jgi:hypothetical protein